ncbi:DUF1289 domain-containing protein [Iodobacter ciconiae]|uniref:DUF1289 domain-containing protein n=1 Tax=Iodobacter ciconiae TaxID=2496266 RepID=A0A3S8ZVK6_9NEIS|nr:DUF1289 domain-containing protein [Iodobacter ciconiae]AZN37455.1 DUF1289 domain-containing protein [Iodobacter ciconiae]
MTEAIPSPCIQQCKLDDTQTCTGCRRTIDEISLWSKATETEKTAIWQRLLALPLIMKSKQCQRCGAKFSCGSGGQQGGCWCMDLPPVLSPASITGDCFCPTCLNQQMTERKPC